MLCSTLGTLGAFPIELAYTMICVLALPSLASLSLRPGLDRAHTHPLPLSRRSARPSVRCGTLQPLLASAMAVNWPAKDIIYVSIVGSVMLAALLEWFLWLLAFLYCLVKVYQKAENVSTKVLAITMMVVFLLLRGIFLPVMIVTLPLPSQVTQSFPRAAVSFLQWFAFWTFSALLVIPWLLCIYQLVTNSLGRTKRIKHILDESTAPKVVIVMPCYKEIPEILLRTVDSLVDCDYPSSCLHIFLSFDGEREDDLYLSTIRKLGVPLVRRSGFPVSVDVAYRDTRVTVSRFPHGGKRSCQKRTFKLIDKIYSEYLKVNDNLFVLFIDSDCILDKVCIQNFMYEMELKPGSKHNMLAMTGVITATTEKNSIITLLQDMEYIHGQLFERAVESGCGAVTCLPGALTILRFSAFRKLAKEYFSDKAEQCDDLFDYGKCHLGEDRWLTHLFMIASERRYQIGMSTGAFCKTEAVQTYSSLLKQRRRWFLGFITNEVCMLTDGRLWARYPVLCLIRVAQNTIRTTALLFFIIVISLMTTSQKIESLPVGFIAVSLGLNWALMCYFATNLGRYKIMLYPILFVIGPFFNWVYIVYGILTAGQRTWGGPRADASKADMGTTPQQAIEQARAAGDDLNIRPETFRSAIESRTLGPGSDLPRVSLQPAQRFVGRFKSTPMPPGWYSQPRDTDLGFDSPLARISTAPHILPTARRSFESYLTTSSVNFPVGVFGRNDGSAESLEVAHRPRPHPPLAASAYYEFRSSLPSHLSGNCTTLEIPSRRGSQAYSFTNSTSQADGDLSSQTNLYQDMSVFHDSAEMTIHASDSNVPLVDLRPDGVEVVINRSPRSTCQPSVHTRASSWLPRTEAGTTSQTDDPGGVVDRKHGHGSIKWQKLKKKFRVRS